MSNNILDIIKQKGYKNILVVAGAGISAGSGIPDFRTSGFFDKLVKKHGVSTVEELFSRDLFDRKPWILYDIVNQMTKSSQNEDGSIKEPQPCKAHLFIKHLQDLGILGRVITQNIDGLELKAGVDPDKVVQAHGTIKTGKCTKCDNTFEMKSYEEVMHCYNPSHSESGEIVKPDIVLYGDPLPVSVNMRNIRAWDFDCCLVMGTSLKVYPVAAIPQEIDCDVYVLNNQELPNLRHAKQFIRDLETLCNISSLEDRAAASPVAASASPPIEGLPIGEALAELTLS